MFYYYGAKNQLAKHYPDPIFDIIVEPFAGSAAYAQRWRRDHTVVLIEKDERITDLWSWLLSMTPEEVLAIEVPVAGEYYAGNMDTLIKCCAASNGVSRMSGPLKTPARMARDDGRDWKMMLRRIAERVDDCRDWTIITGDYNEAETYINETYGLGTPCTWFIDPPYQNRMGNRGGTSFPLGDGYRHSDIDYKALAAWLDCLHGQVMVCEQVGARWLRGEYGFRELKMHHDSQGRRSMEVVAYWETELASANLVA